MKRVVSFLVIIAILMTMTMPSVFAAQEEMYEFYVVECEKVNPNPDEVCEFYEKTLLEMVCRDLYFGEENVKVKIAFRYDMPVQEMYDKTQELYRADPILTRADAAEELHFSDFDGLYCLVDNYHYVNSYKLYTAGKILPWLPVQTNKTMHFYDGMKKVQATFSYYINVSEYCRQSFPQELKDEAKRIKASSDVQSEQARQALRFTVDHLRYDHEYSVIEKYNAVNNVDENGVEINSSSPMITLEEGLAICNGYSYLYNSLCFLIDLPCIFCIANPVHAYNQVFTNGSWKNVNSTWDDPQSNDDSWFRRYFSEDEVDQEIVDRTALYFDESSKEELAMRPLARKMAISAQEQVEKLKAEGAPKRERTLISCEWYALPQKTCEVGNVSSWAKDLVSRSILYNRVPYELFDVDYTRPITRLEMCYLAYHALMGDRYDGGYFGFYNQKFNFQNLPSTSFKDISDDRLDLLSKLSVITGFSDGSFKPDETLTRAQLATIVYKVKSIQDENFAKKNRPEGSAPFRDTQNHWAENYIAAMYNLGYMKGVGDNLFDPDSALTIEQAIVTLERLQPAR